MTDPFEPDDAEVVDALPVDPEERLDDPVRRQAQPAPAPAQAAPLAARGPERSASPVRAVPVAQAAAVAATGFAAGAVTAAVVRGVGKRRATKAAAKRSTRHGLPIAGTRSFLVDVHLLGPKD